MNTFMVYLVTLTLIQQPKQCKLYGASLNRLLDEFVTEVE